ncbi:MAG: methionyl-tRNA formyltransferase [Leptolyngbyaceae cyanobacterium bins.302]|nr:methionyl-tRNA formyltransferase [Leptolyngbyaceae cyanobacterium bins.302]
MKLVFFGTPEFAVPSLKRLVAQAEFEVLAVVTQPDKRRGRGNQLMPSPVKTIAVEHSIPVWQPKSVKKNAETLAFLEAAQADAFVVVAYGQILSQAILDMPRLGCVNAHGSILPKYRGAAPIQWSIYNGDRETGITTMLMDAGMDTGAMLLEARTPINLLENFHEVAARLADLAAELLVETLLKLEQGTLTPIPQDATLATYAPLIQKSDYELDWARSAIALHNQVRGFYPNCFTTFRGEPLKITATVPFDPTSWEQLPPDYATDYAGLQQEWATWSQPSGQPGAVVAIAKGLGAIVQTGDGLLLLKAVQQAGKRAQTGMDFVNGTRLEPGERFSA